LPAVARRLKAVRAGADSGRVFVFATCVGTPAKYERYALPGLRRAAELDSLIVETSTETSIHEAYNEILQAVAAMPGVEALVLLHEDTELLDPTFCDRVRLCLAEEPDAAVIGAIGARGVRGLSWWEGERAGRVTETRGRLDFGGGRHDVDSVDGLLLVLAPWAIASLRCDAERFGGFHAYDVDLCFQARAAGRRVVVDELDVFHHTKGGFGDLEAFRRADAAFGEKWGVRPVEAA
jgi:hypothetical protein